MPVGVIESLDHEARGITYAEGKKVFVDGALPGEIVEYASFRRKPNFEIAHLVGVRSSSPFRVKPRCDYFGICGGCAMQHLEQSAQIAAKQRVLEDSLAQLGRVRAGQILSPIHGGPWGYRHRARLSVRNVPTKGGVLVGFHECRSSYIADMRSCAVLPPHVSDLLLPLRELVAALSVAERLPKIDVAVGEYCTALLLRILEPLTGKDEDLLRGFADRHGVVFYLQPKGPDSVYRFYPVPGPRLSYLLPELGLEFEFRPTDFTQVNHAVNRVLVRRALRLLDPQPGERIADLFCGSGNFSLPLACSGASVVGLEGSQALVERGRENAVANALAGRVEFAAANLFARAPESLAALGHFDRMLIDPPREGAIEVVKALSGKEPRRIVYVSCNPATLARDAAVLVQVKGYSLTAAGVVNMFPHTCHVESIAVFDKECPRGIPSPAGPVT
jgi:23S rRNA (uracil1939-C5)-methyltransferase